ncbi:MAG: alpha-galactosidase [Victivallales bacterium]|nr:alpha-galactosidase [Victivallales bacterium]
MDIKIEYSNDRIENHPVSESFTEIKVTPTKTDTLVSAIVQIPLIDVFSCWHSALTPGLTPRIPWVEKIPCGAQKNFPFYALLSRSGRVKAAFSSTNLIDDCEISFAINQEQCTGELAFSFALSTETQPFSILLDLKSRLLTDSLKAWRDKLHLPKLNYPAGAYEPVYCTWYVVHGEVNQTFVEETCPIAKELGFGTLIVDDGWCYDEYKRVSPKTITNWYESVGDWNVSPVKFPHFKEHVKRIQAMGMNYLLWVAPHLFGRHSKMLEAYREQILPDYVEGYYKMDVNTANSDVLVDKLRTLAKEYSLDGLKIDFLDIVSPNVNQPNARNTLHFIEKICGGLKADNPDALIEFRQSYATPAMLPWGTQFRAGDAPFDWRLNFGRLVEIRLNIGNLGPVHADPAYWAPGELPENISRHLMAMLVGVPMLSMDLRTLTETERRIIRHYLDFYNQHRMLINHGKWSVLFSQTEIAAAIAEDATERLVILADGNTLADALGTPHKNTWVMNLSDKTLHIASAKQIFAADCLPGENGTLPPGGSGFVSAASC